MIFNCDEFGIEEFNAGCRCSGCKSARITELERENEELRIQVRELVSIIDAYVPDFVKENW